MTQIDAYCLLLAVGGAALLFWGKRRAFLRTNSFGVETFSSYARSLVARSVDGTLMVVGAAMLAAAPLLFAIEHAGEWVALAIFVYILYLFERDWYRRRR